MQFSMRILASVIVGVTIVSCSNHGDSPDRTAVSSAALAASPQLGNFLIYAERSVKLGTTALLFGGDVGVHRAAPASFGPQAVFGPTSALDSARTLFSPSVSLAFGSSVAHTETNGLTNNGGSASMIKLVALYAAFELRKTVRAIAAELGSKATPSDLLDQAKAHLDPRVIAYAARSAGLKGVANGEAVSRLKSTFKTAAASPAVGVDFTDDYKKHQSGMISVSDNNDAGSCIHGCGYGMINGICENAGFFQPSTQKGLWLAGDFSHQYHSFKIPTASTGGVNFGPAAQAATVMQLVKLLALMFKGALVDSGAARRC
jgi:hypothetical protein